MNKTLVTGGAGFIGSHLCKKILESGKKVICLDNMFLFDKLQFYFLYLHLLYMFLLIKMIIVYLCKLLIYYFLFD